ncbi:acyl carrier protein [Salinisphaera sp. USBA-960]|uniref:acyl carrier protein n=1 Tax=Salinisphaera orenii TaxID=856731 RepID=UPI000DBE4E67|nr:acyl carrier protein [Salifodinibacter halophilus]NNC26746.1 acyl carrier protein [Salifodinibacter halophilus]
MSRYDEIAGHLRDVLKPYLPADQTIDDDTRLVDDVGLSSMQIMEVMMELEDQLDASIPQNILPEVETFAELVTAIDAHV